MASLSNSIQTFSAELRSFAAKTVEEVGDLRRSVNARPCVGRTSPPEISQVLTQRMQHFLAVGVLVYSCNLGILRSLKRLKQQKGSARNLTASDTSFHGLPLSHRL